MPLCRSHSRSSVKFPISKVCCVVALMAIALTETTLTGSSAARGRSGLIAPAQIGEPVPAGSGLIARFDNDGLLTIPTGGTVNSSVTVSQVSGPIVKVSVSLYLTYTYDPSLAISLIGP